MPHPAPRLALAAALLALTAPAPAPAQDEALSDALRRLEAQGFGGLPGPAPGAGPAPDAPDAAVEPRDAFAPMPPPGPRPYPFAILGARPGMTAPEARAAIEAETGAPVELVPETMRLRVAAPDGRSFETAYAVKLVSPYDPRDGLAERLDPTAPREPFDRYGLVLATPASDGRVLGVTRAMRRPSVELPEPAALRAQLEGMYGPPSQVEQAPNRLTMIWAWGEDGPIADLEGQPARTIEHDVAPGDIRTDEYRPCLTTGSLIYEFEHPRERPLHPGCVATYSATYSAGNGHATLSFDLYDYALARVDRAEADHQIVDKVLGEEVAPVAPSELPL